ncbi:hypothetical protein EV44_g4179 [Erysiphe necator]|uniref:CCHC-type domain-containing protein n=1 Tax=Uncinula necator TaxID=52586 RepID=A0A0B1PAH5_UNCNE|nr:hypothetical protein EV44_g4179 [Erysiphe necator]
MSLNTQFENQKFELKRVDNRAPKFSNSQHSNPNGQKNYKVSDSKILPLKTISKNPYVNGSRLWNKSMVPLCVRCGEVGHASPKCDSYSTSKLENWEQSYLKEMVFSIDAQMCMLQINDSQPQNEDSTYCNANNWRENDAPEVNKMSFEQFGSNNRLEEKTRVFYELSGVRYRNRFK